MSVLVTRVLTSTSLATLIALGGCRSKTPPPSQAYSPPRALEQPLQSNEEGYYIPSNKFRVTGFQFEGFALHPDPLVLFASVTDSVEHPSSRCDDATISSDTIHLRCLYESLGAVSIDGNFLVKNAIGRMDTAVVSAVVTVRSNGQVLHQGRDSFIWILGE
jgi:hypothetical protein